MSSDHFTKNQFVCGISSAEYHKKVLGVVSNGALKLFSRCPAKYRWWVDAPDEAPTPAMEFGSLFHCLVLEPQVFESLYVIEPNFGDCRKTINNETKKAWHALNESRRKMSQEDYDRARWMRDAVMLHTDARAIVEQSDHEVSGFWTDPETGLRCKMRADCWISRSSIIGDIKTCVDATEAEFAKSIANFGYHRQAALYCMGAEVLNSATTHDFVFLAVEKDPPYLVATYVLSRVDLNHSIEVVREQLRAFKTCIEDDSWPALGQRTKTISLPGWAK